MGEWAVGLSLCVVAFVCVFPPPPPQKILTFPPALSTGTGGRGVTSDPVAIRTFLVCRGGTLEPSFVATDTVLGPDTVPLPLW